MKKYSFKIQMIDNSEEIEKKKNFEIENLLYDQNKNKEIGQQTSSNRCCE